MVRKQTGSLMGYPSRREVLRGLAGLMITMSLARLSRSWMPQSEIICIPTMVIPTR